MEDGLFPSYMTIVSDDPSDIEEERRLAYVGITRAMNDLTLTCARMRMTRGETQYNPMSRFIREIPEELMDNRPPASRRRLEDADMLAGLIGIGGGGAGRGSYREGGSGEGIASGGTGEKSGYDFRPKAVLRTRATAKADKPFIAREMGSLNQLAGISKGMPTQPEAELSYGVGDRVSHIKYGEGKVTALVREPRDYKVTVDFDKAGTKIMYASFAKLKRL
jgi:DNA helicase-2/ATP-dependent DNA helicase PcrA